MTTAIVLFASAVCVCMCAAAQGDTASGIVCNLNAIKAADRPRYQALLARIRAAVRDRREVSNGYVFKLDNATVSLTEAAEWIEMERLCCPFLKFRLDASGSQTYWLLRLTGPKGVKALLDCEFPSR